MTTPKTSQERNTESAGLRESEETGKEKLTAVAKEYHDALSVWLQSQSAPSNPENFLASEFAFRTAIAARRKFDLAMDEYLKSRFP